MGDIEGHECNIANKIRTHHVLRKSNKIVTTLIPFIPEHFIKEKRVLRKYKCEK